MATRHPYRRNLRTALLAGAVAGAMFASAATAQDGSFNFSIPAESLSKALRDYGRASGLQLIFSEDLTTGRQAPPVQGNFTAHDALDRLLGGSGLVAQTTPAGVVMIQRGAAALSQTDAPAGASASAAPQTADATVEVVTVTARKRAERLIDVPVAVTELSSAAIQRYASTNLTEIGQLVPGVSLERTAGGASGAVLTIRGVGNIGQDYNTEQPVAINIDGVQLTRGHIADVGLFDVQSVQVLKGPQALYFGKNSPAGVVSLDSVSPNGTFEGYLRSGYEFATKTPSIEGAVSFPITDTLSARVAGRYSDMLGGYIKNDAKPIADPFDPGGLTLPGAANRDQPGIREGVGRFTLAWKPNSPFDATLKVLGADYHDDGGASGQEIFSCSGAHPTTVNLFTSAGVQDPYGSCSANNHVSLGQAPSQIAAHIVGGPSDGKPFTHTQTLLTSLTVNYRLPNITLTSVTGYYVERQADYDNFDQSVYAQALDAQFDSDHQISQELRASSHYASPVNFTVGAFYSHDGHKDGDTDKIFPLGPYSGTGPYAGAYNTIAMLAENRSESYSVFGELHWKILPDLELEGGARYSHDTESTRIGNIFNYFDLIAPTANPFSPAGVVYTPGVKESNVSPEVTLTYHPEHNVTLYGAYKTGYLAGGSANPANVSNYTTLANPNEPFEFNKETVSGGEIGAKGLLLDGRLSADLTFYHYTYTGLQVQTFDPSNLSYAIHNGANALNQGIEFQASYRVAQGFDVHGSLELVDLKYLKYANAPCYPGQSAGCNTSTLPGSITTANPTGQTITAQNLSGTNYGDSPVSLNVGATYNQPLSEAWGLRLAGDVFYNSRSPRFEQDPAAYTPAYTIVNASVALYQQGGPLEIALIATNLGNDIYYKNFLFKPLGANNDIVAESIGLPREVTLQATYRF